MIRNDFVSNSSSCSFIIHIKNKKDLEHLKTEQCSKIFKERRPLIADKFYKLPYGNNDHYKNPEDLKINDFLWISIGEDNEYDIRYEDPYDILCDIAHKLNENYNSLTFYMDKDAHVSYGQPYNKKEYEND